MKPNLKKLLSRDYLITVVLTLLLYPLLYLLSQNWLLAGAFSGISAGGLVSLRRRFLNSLAQRSNENDSVEWTVEINGVSVGKIKDSDYAAIRHHVFSDARNYFDQVANAWKVLLRLVDYFYIGIPLAVFWLGLALVIASPETVTAMAADIEKNGAAAIAAGAFLLLKVCGVLALLLVLMHVIFGFSRYGFENCFELATREIVRRRFGVVADGKVHLVRWNNYGVPSFYSDWGAMEQSSSAKLGKPEH